MTKTKAEQINVTTDYSMFIFSENNRDVNRNHPDTKRLERSMLEYGWLPAFPIMVKRADKKLLVVDGQHRLSIAREYGIPVRYVVDDTDICVSRLNETQHSWDVNDHVYSHAKSGNSDYAEAIEMHREYGITLSMVCAILSNTAYTGNVGRSLRDGTWRITNRPLAYSVAETHRALSNVHPVFKKANSLKAIWACYSVEYFDPARLIAGASKISGSIRNITKIDLIYDLFEQAYNHGRQQKFPLRFDAEEAMSNRSAAKKKTAQAA